MSKFSVLVIIPEETTSGQVEREVFRRLRPYQKIDGSTGFWRSYEIGGLWQDSLLLYDGQAATVARKKDIDFRAYSAPFSTFAVVDSDGWWYARGRANRYGYLSEELEPEHKWQSEFKGRFIDPLGDNMILVIVECQN